MRFSVLLLFSIDARLSVEEVSLYRCGESRRASGAKDVANRYISQTLRLKWARKVANFFFFLGPQVIQPVKLGEGGALGDNRGW